MIYKLKSDIDLEGNVGINVLKDRGVEDIADYLNPTIEAECDPLLLDNIVTAAETLYKHLKKGSNIFIQVDSDADGYCSAAIIYQYIKNVNPKAKIQWRIHEGKQHGIISETIPEGTGLVIIPDAGR